MSPHNRALCRQAVSGQGRRLRLMVLLGEQLDESPLVSKGETCRVRGAGGRSVRGDTRKEPGCSRDGPAGCATTGCFPAAPASRPPGWWG